jgi:hypothetical protein
MEVSVPMKITLIESGLWNIEGVGNLERTSQGTFYVVPSTGVRLSGEEIAQIHKFIEDTKSGN